MIALPSTLARAAIVAFIAAAMATHAENFAPGQRHALNHVIVKFKDTALSPAIEGRDNEVARLNRKLALPRGATLRESAWGKTKRVAADFMYLDLPPGLSVADCLGRLKKLPEIEYAEPDGIGHGGGELIPTDLDFVFQWHHRNTVKPTASSHTPEAWTITTGANTTIVAVLDTGINTTLGEFSRRLVPGYNFVSNTTDPSDDHGHGSAVSTVLCGNANNALGGAGVNWNCRLMPVKVLNEVNYGLYSWWAQGINYAVANGAKVINLSAGGTGSSIALTTAINNAIAAGVIFVTITQNDGTGVITYPGNLADPITVGATDQQDRRSTFSNYGSAIDLVAPGTAIHTIGRHGTLEFWNGTSFAAPQVAGVASLLCGLNPNLKQADIRALLCSGADDRVGDATDTAGFDIYYGNGRLNAYNSLLLAQTQIDQITTAGAGLSISWTTPANAATRKPYEIFFRALNQTTWTRVASADAITYQGAQATWTTPSPTPGLYQVAIR
jgi:thermitase